MSTNPAKVPNALDMDFGIVAADRWLDATPEEYQALSAALESEEAEYIAHHNYWHGFEIQYREGKVHVSSPDFGIWELLPNCFLKLLGALIARNRLDYLEFGVAWSWLCGTGGTYFRIRKDGSVWEPKLIW